MNGAKIQVTCRTQQGRAAYMRAHETERIARIGIFLQNGLILEFST